VKRRINKQGGKKKGGKNQGNKQGKEKIQKPHNPGNFIRKTENRGCSEQSMRTT
jgi:hypothetical protein